MKLRSAIAAILTVATGFLGSMPMPVTPVLPDPEVEWEHVLTAIPMRSRAASSGWGTTPIVCTSSYDFLHPGVKSNRRRVNAHLSVRCTGTDAHLTQISLKSQMKEGGRWGLASYGKGKKSVRTGEDLACISAPRIYRATGSIAITLPPGYRPMSHSNTKCSERKKFKRDKKGLCLQAR